MTLFRWFCGTFVFVVIVMGAMHVMHCNGWRFVVGASMIMIANWLDNVIKEGA